MIMTTMMIMMITIIMMTTTRVAPGLRCARRQILPGSEALNVRRQQSLKDEGYDDENGGYEVE